MFRSCETYNQRTYKDPSYEYINNTCLVSFLSKEMQFETFG